MTDEDGVPYSGRYNQLPVPPPPQNRIPQSPQPSSPAGRLPPVKLTGRGLPPGSPLMQGPVRGSPVPPPPGARSGLSSSGRVPFQRVTYTPGTVPSTTTTTTTTATTPNATSVTAGTGGVVGGGGGGGGTTFGSTAIIADNHNHTQWSIGQHKSPMLPSQLPQHQQQQQQQQGSRLAEEIPPPPQSSLQQQQQQQNYIPPPAASHVRPKAKPSIMRMQVSKMGTLRKSKLMYNQESAQLSLDDYLPLPQDTAPPPPPTPPIAPPMIPPPSTGSPLSGPAPVPVPTSPSPRPVDLSSSPIVAAGHQHRLSLTRPLTPGRPGGAGLNGPSPLGSSGGGGGGSPHILPPPLPAVASSPIVSSRRAAAAATAAAHTQATGTVGSGSGSSPLGSTVAAGVTAVASRKEFMFPEGPDTTGRLVRRPVRMTRPAVVSSVEMPGVVTAALTEYMRDFYVYEHADARYGVLMNTFGELSNVKKYEPACEAFAPLRVHGLYQDQGLGTTVQSAGGMRRRLSSSDFGADSGIGSGNTSSGAGAVTTESVAARISPYIYAKVRLDMKLREVSYAHRDFEPLFLSVAVYNRMFKRKVSEDCWLQMNDPGVLNAVGLNALTQYDARQITRAVFATNGASSMLFFVIKAYRIFHGDIDKDQAAMTKARADAAQYRAELAAITAACAGAPPLQPYYWAAAPVYGEGKEGLIHTHRVDTFLPLKGALTDDMIFEYLEGFGSAKKVRNPTLVVSFDVEEDDAAFASRITPLQIPLIPFDAKREVNILQKQQQQQQ